MNTEDKPLVDAKIYFNLTVKNLKNTNRMSKRGEHTQMLPRQNHCLFYCNPNRSCFLWTYVLHMYYTTTCAYLRLIFPLTKCK